MSGSTARWFATTCGQQRPAPRPSRASTPLAERLSRRTAPPLGSAAHRLALRSRKTVVRQCIASPPRHLAQRNNRQHFVNQGSAPWARNRSTACAAPGDGCRPDRQPHEARRAARRGLRTPRRNLHPRRRADRPAHTPRSPHQARCLLATGRARPAPSIRPKRERARTARTGRSRAATGTARAGTNARDRLSAHAARDCHLPDCALHHAAGSVRHHVGPPQHSDPTGWLRSWYERVCADWRAHAVFASIETEPSRFCRLGRRASVR
jgi:hypothetical protein